MKKNFVLLGLMTGLSFTSAAQAQVGVTANLGTTGLGFHLSVPVQPQLNTRFGINALSYDYHGNTSDVDYDAKLKMRTFDALLDYYPMSSNFRLSGGVVYNGNKIDANGRPSAGGTYTLNGRTYTASTVGSIDAHVDFRRFAPYLGIGWGNAVAKSKGWGFSADLGVLFQGSPRTTLTHTGCAFANPICGMLAADIAGENRDLQNEVNDLKAFPVLRVGVSYSFYSGFHINVGDSRNA